MARYVDADRLIESLELSIKSWGRDCNSNAPKMVMAYQEVLYRLKNMLVVDVVSIQELDQALGKKARECNMAIDKICIEHRAEYARLHEAHQEELAKAKREVARRLVAEVNLLVSKYHLEPNYSMGQMEFDLAELEKKYTKGATDGKAEQRNSGNCKCDSQ